MKILFVQPGCPEYRYKFFELMSEKFKGMGILHFWDNCFDKNSNFLIDELNTSKFSFKGIHIIKKLELLIDPYDVIVVGFDPHWINAFLLPLISKKKIVYWGHGLGKNWAMRLFRLSMFKSSSALVTYNEYDRNVLVTDKGLDGKKIFTANNTIHINNSEDLSNSDKKYFLYVGRLQLRKELDLVIRCIAKLKNLGVDALFYILGDGEVEKKRLLSLSKELEIESQIKFLNGTTDDIILKNVFRNAIAYISPGHVGLGVLHSFAYGVPVITFKERDHAPEFHNIVNKVNGFISNEEDLKSILTMPKNRFQEMGARAFIHYRDNASISLMVNGFVQAINFASNDPN